MPNIFSKKVFRQITISNTARVLNFARLHGLRKTLIRIWEKIHLLIITNDTHGLFDPIQYKKWIAKYEPSTEDLALQRKRKFEYSPKISIIVPTYNTPLPFLKQLFNSVHDQTYDNWELCIADGSNEEITRKYLINKASKDKRVKLTLLKYNYGIAGNTNKAIDLATGDYVIFLDHDDTLAPFALYEIVNTLSINPDADVIYSDEDKISYNGLTRTSPHFKPDWSPDTLLSYNYITHLFTIKNSLLQHVGCIRSGFEGAQDYDLVLRATEKARQVVHIPKVLYHWREHSNSTSTNIESKTYVTFSTQRAVSDYLERNGIDARVFGGPFFGSARIVYTLYSKPLISIIIPTKNETETIKNCIDSIICRTTYSNFEILIVDTGSNEDSTWEYYETLSSDKRIKILRWEKPFNYSAVNNFAAKSALGEYLLFLNNDTEIQTAEWIESMLEFCQRDDVGAVGAKLFYPDFTIQHAGVILGIGGIAGHSHKSFPRNSTGYFGRLSVPTNLSAVTAACVMIPSKVFKEVGGFDEEFPLAFNDVDICLKIRKRNYLIVWTPHAQLIHHESKTRGPEDNPEKQERFKKEIALFHGKWDDVLLKGDPYYNINLTLKHENFSIKLDNEI